MYNMLLLFSHSVVSDSVTPWTAARQAFLALSISQRLPKFMSIASVLPSSDALFSFCPQSFPASGTFPMGWPFTSDNQNTGASTSTSVCPTSIRGWFPLRLTSLISLLFKGLPGVFSSTRTSRYQFFDVCLLYGPALTTVHDHWKYNSLDYMDLCWQSNVSAFQHTV